MTEQPLLKQGPLGHIWLAANYDKKLSKQQLMNTSIVQSSKLISKTPISNWNSPSQNADIGNTISLRISGQLLLGIVKIYSRKTRYLLDDMSDILLRLKNSFKLARGDLGIGSENRVVNALPQQTTLTNLNTITLQDQVTGFDLLYQDDLNLDVLEEATHDNTEDSFTFDDSIEFPRYREDDNDNDPIDYNGMDLELDFDLNDDDEGSDRSIEVGRDNVNEQNMPEISLLDDLKNANDDLDFDLYLPLDTNLDIEQNGHSSDGPAEPATPPPESEPPQRRSKKPTVSEDGQLLANKRKLKIDDVADMGGIPIQVLKDNQQAIMNRDYMLSVSLTSSEKLQLVNELAAPSFKKRKIWNVDDQLRSICHDLSIEEQRQLDEQHELQFQQEHEDHTEDITFDLSLPGLSSEPNNEEEEIIPRTDSQLSSVKFTEEVAHELKDIFATKEVTNLSDLMERDLMIDDTDLNSQNSMRTNTNPRSKASKRFFEMLVLATQDCVSLSQECNGEDIGGPIDIRARDALFSKFM